MCTCQDPNRIECIRLTLEVGFDIGIMIGLSLKGSIAWEVAESHGMVLVWFRATDKSMFSVRIGGHGNSQEAC